MSEKLDLFYYLNNLYSKRSKPSDESEASSFIWPINRFLSMDKDLLETIAHTTRYLFTLGPRYYKLLWRVIPQTNAARNKYLKPEKDNMELTSRYAQYFGVSKRETVDYLKILNKKYSQKEIYGFVGLEVKK